MALNQYDIRTGFARTLRTALLALTVLVFSACTAVPFANIVSVRNSEDTLLVTATTADRRETFVKIIDSQTYAVRQKVPAGAWCGGEIAAVFPEGEGLLVLSREGKSGITAGRLTPGQQTPWQRVGSLGAQTALVAGRDADFLYTLSTADRKPGGVLLQGVRFDGSLRSQRAGHFDEQANLVALRVLEDDAAFWYVSTERRVIPVPQAIKDVSGRLVIVRKQKEGGALRLFEYGADPIRSVQAVADNGTIWLFVTAEIQVNNRQAIEYRIIRFFKTEGTFMAKVVPKSVTLFPHDGVLADTGSLWGMAGDKIIRIDTGTMAYTATALPKNFRTTTNLNRQQVLFSTNDSLLIAAYDFGSKTRAGGQELPVPYVLRYAKRDMSYEQIMVKPTKGEAAWTGPKNVCLGVYGGCCLEPMDKFNRYER